MDGRILILCSICRTLTWRLTWSFLLHFSFACRIVWTGGWIWFAILNFWPLTRRLTRWFPVLFFRAFCFFSGSCKQNYMSEWIDGRTDERNILLRNNLLLTYQFWVMFHTLIPEKLLQRYYHPLTVLSKILFFRPALYLLVFFVCLMNHPKSACVDDSTWWIRIVVVDQLVWIYWFFLKIVFEWLSWCPRLKMWYDYLSRKPITCSFRSKYEFKKLVLCGNGKTDGRTNTCYLFQPILFKILEYCAESFEKPSFSCKFFDQLVAVYQTIFRK